jgi:hypothetical protein
MQANPDKFQVLAVGVHKNFKQEGSQNLNESLR